MSAKKFRHIQFRFSDELAERCIDMHDQKFNEFQECLTQAFEDLKECCAKLCEEQGHAMVAKMIREL